MLLKCIVLQSLQKYHWCLSKHAHFSEMIWSCMNLVIVPENIACCLKGLFQTSCLTQAVAQASQFSQFLTNFGNKQPKWNTSIKIFIRSIQYLSDIYTGFCLRVTSLPHMCGKHGTLIHRITTQTSNCVLKDILKQARCHRCKALSALIQSANKIQVLSIVFNSATQVVILLLNYTLQALSLRGTILFRVWPGHTSVRRSSWHGNWNLLQYDRQHL